MKMLNLKLIFGSLVLLFAFIGQVDAARLGGGKSIGRTPSAPMQRQATPAPAAKPPQAAPAPTPAAAPAATPSRFGGFGGILGGLAAGLGLGYLFSHLGMGEMGSGIASLITGVLIAFLIGMVALFILRRFVPAFSKSNPASVDGGMQRASYGATPRQQEPTFAPTASTPVVEAPLDVPPGFHEYSFLENAKQYFIKLQKAWDIGDLHSLREFATPEMYATLQQDLQARFEASNQTDVVTLEARLLGMETAAGSYLCSVQFSGLIREQVGAPANSFSEIWNLSKPVEGPGGWVLAGIQQVI